MTVSTTHSGSSGIIGLILVIIAIVYFSRRLRGANSRRPSNFGDGQLPMPTLDIPDSAPAVGLAAIAPEPTASPASSTASTAGTPLAESRGAFPNESRPHSPAARTPKRHVAAFGIRPAAAPMHGMSAITAMTSRTALPALGVSVPAPPMVPRDALPPHQPLARRGT